MSIFADDENASYELSNLYEGRSPFVKLKKVNGDKITFMRYKDNFPKIHQFYNFEPNVEYEMYRVSYDDKFEKLKNFTGTPDIIGRIEERANKPTISGPMDMSYHKNVYGKDI
ncbi:MAG: hypothetical protein WD512_00720, partial [Candidatus Paceibacterota bacterium]